MNANQMNPTAPQNETPKDPTVLHELVGKRERFSKHFLVEGNRGAAVLYNTPVHFKENGQWEEIDNTLEQDDDGSYRNRRSELSVRFAENSSEESLVTLTKQGYEISWKLKTNLRTRSAPLPSSFEVYRNNSKMARSAKLLTPEEEQQKKLSAPNNKSRGVYSNILPDIDLEYTLMGESLKENIFLHSANAADTLLQFEVHHKGLQTRLNQEGELELFAPEEPEQIVYFFPTPFMFDAQMQYCSDVCFELSAGEDTSMLTLHLDADWLHAEGREYPVVIDPVTHTNTHPKYIDDTFAIEKSPNQTAQWLNGTCVVGRTSDYGRCRSFIQFENLPVLSNGDLIYKAYLSVYHYRNPLSNIPSLRVTAHRITGGWSGRNLTWNNQPSYDSTVLDYQTITDNKNGNTLTITQKYFDITKVVRDWYNTGVNNGVMLKSENESQAVACEFFSSDYPKGGSVGFTDEEAPTGIFYYKNAAGLEDYWSYHTQSAGRAGTGYTNDFNGNLTFIHDVMATSGNRLPVAIKQVYNLCDCDTNSRFGYGWRLNVKQRLEETGDSSYPYVYTDEDGTRHYFYKDSNDGNKLKDEDGLGLEISNINPNSELKYTLSLKDKSKLLFDIWSDLRRTIDTNGNTISYNYSPRSDGNYLSTITDPTGALLDLYYTSGYERLSYILDSTGRKTAFHYDDAALNLTSINYPDGTVTRFEYDGKKLKKAISPDGYTVEYQYTQDYKIPRVSKITEMNGSSIGQAMLISYRNGTTTVFEDCGLDGDTNTHGDNQVTTYVFDNMGRPTCVYDQDGNANSYQYFTEGAKNNKLSKTGSMQKTVCNYLTNPGIDTNIGHDKWYHTALAEGGSYDVSRMTNEGYYGSTSIRVGNSNPNAAGGIAQDVTLNAGTYTLSAYAKTSGITPTKETEAGAFLMVTQYNGSTKLSDTKSARYISGTTDTAIDRGWERLEVTFTVAGNNTNVRVFGGMLNSTGTVWFDCFQLESGSAANKYNLIYNSDFEDLDGTNRFYSWGCDDTNPVGNAARFGSHSCVIHGEPGKRKNTAQPINVSGEKGDVYQLSGWVKANAIPGKEFRIAAAVLYSSGDPIWHMFDCNPCSSEWQYVTGIVPTDDNNQTNNRKYVAIHIYMFFADTYNEAYFDGMQLIKDDGESYVYDSEGSLVSAKSASQKSGFSHDKKDNLTKLIDPEGTSFEYGYDDKNNLVNARNSEGVQYNFQYDSYGNPTESRIFHSRTTTSVTDGQIYYIRNKFSGKYLDNNGNGDANGTLIQQYVFVGGKDNTYHRFKAVSTGDGYFQFVFMHSATARVLDVQGAGDANGTALELYQNNGADAQKFKLRPMADGSCLIIAKCSRDTKALDNHTSSTDNNAMITTWDINETTATQRWYFEPVMETISDVPKAGKSYNIRARHSGQYLDLRKTTDT